MILIFEKDQREDLFVHLDLIYKKYLLTKDQKTPKSF